MDVNRKIRILFGLLIFIVIFNLASFFFIFLPRMQGPDDFRPGPHNHFGPYDKPENIHKKILEELNMTNEQIKYYSQYRKEFLDETRIYLDSIRYYNQKIDENITSENIDKQIINRYIDRIGHCHVRIKQNSIQYFLNVKGILNKQQQKKYEQIYLEIRKKRRVPFCNN